MNVLVSGANRGLGFGIVKELLKQDNVKHELSAIDDPRLHILEMELLEHITIGSVYVKVRDVVGQDGLNVIINNAAVQEPYDLDKRINRRSIVAQIEVNAIGPMIICQAFLPQLRKAVKGGGKAMIVNVSDENASMEKCKGGTRRKGIVYQMSKAATNMLTRSLAEDIKDDEITLLAMSPGSVKTDMGGERAESTVEQAAAEMVDKILNQITHKYSGGFFNRQLEPVPY